MIDVLQQDFVRTAEAKGLPKSVVLRRHVLRAGLMPVVTMMGLQFGFLQFNDPQKAVEYGAAHGALASTTPGDTSMATRKEVEKQISGGGARVVR